MKCPACDSTDIVQTKNFFIYVCRDCNAIFGSVAYESDLGEYINRHEWPKENVTELRYFDFGYLNCRTGKNDRVHGWYDPKTKLVHQWG